jgi:hypothetical protein
LGFCTGDFTDASIFMGFRVVAAVKKWANGKAGCDSRAWETRVERIIRLGATGADSWLNDIVQCAEGMELMSDGAAPTLKLCYPWFYGLTAKDIASGEAFE